MACLKNCEHALIYEARKFFSSPIHGHDLLKYKENFSQKKVSEYFWLCEMVSPST